MISAYVPTLDATDEDKDMFYDQLDTILIAIPESEKIFLFGDFNARVGRSADAWTGVIGRHGVGNGNDNGILLISKCAEHRLLITNTTFHLKDKHTTSWMHPRSKHWHLLDYVIIRQRDQADVLLTTAMAGSTACSTDHRLIWAKVAIRIAPKHRKQQTSGRKLDVGKLKDLETSNQFKRDLQERLLSKPDDNLTVEEHWTHVKTALTDACKEAIGFKTKRHQYWSNENEKEIKRLVESKRQAFTDWQSHRHCNTRKAKYHRLRADVQREIRNIKDR